MKLLLICFLFLTAYVYSTESATVEELTRRAEQLLQFTSNEIRVLKEEGRVLSAEGLEREETLLLELLVELRAAEKEGSGVHRAEERLQETEDRLGAELRKLGREFVSQREREEIMRRASQLLNAATSAIEHLRQQNKTLLAEGLVRQETIIIELEVQLRAAQDHEVIRRLEGLLRAAEQEVDRELRQLGRNLKKRDIKDDLVKRAKELQTRAEAEVKQLRSENRTQAAELIAREEKNITDLVQQLEKATAETEIRALEQRLGQQEMRLAGDLRRLGRPINTQELREVLTRRAQELTARANDEIRILKQEGKTQVAEVIQREEQAIAQLVAELKNATQEAEVRAVEEKLGFAEFRLFEELQRQGRPVINRQELERVIRRAEELAVRATIEIRKLREQGKELLAEGLIREEQYLIVLDVELRAAATPDQIHRIEERLQEAEKRVEQELTQLGHSLRKRDVRDDLIKRAEQLEKTANEEVKLLRSENRTNALELIEREERLIQQLVQELKNTSQQSEITRLEERLTERENRLAEDLRRLGRPINPTELRDILVKRAEELTARANQEIKVLQSEGRTSAVQGLQREEKQIAELVAELKNATQQSEIRNLEQRLGLAEFRLGEELRQLGRPFVNPERDALIRRAEEIAVRATVEIRKLREEGRALVAEGLEREERYLIELDVELRTATTPEQIKRLEGRLNEAEQRIQQELRQLGRSTY